MAYTIKKTDGTTLLTLSDSKVDQLTTSLSLIGKNVDSYGEYYNDNLVGLLENFSSLEQPRSPIYGQLWHNRIDGRIYVYGLDDLFSPVAATNVSTTAPTNANQGDFWIDSVNKQLWFTPDGSNFILAGPQYSNTVGKSGWLVETITDSGKNAQVVAALYNQNILLGVASGTAFQPEVSYGGMTYINVGFNLNQSIPNIRFVGTATSADSVQGFTPGDYLQKIGNQILQGTLSVVSDDGLTVGANQDIRFNVDSSSVNIINGVTDGVLKIVGQTSDPGGGASGFVSVTVNSLNRRVGIFNENPAYPLDITGNTRIQGDLIVSGNATYIQSTDLQVTDKNIQLAYGNNTDTVANGGGITLKGSSDHTIVWNNNSTGWNFNTNTNVTSTLSTIMIAGNPVIRATSLGTVITDAPGLNRVGVLDSLTVTNVLIHDSTVQSTGTDATLYLSGTGLGTVDVNSNRITSVVDPIYNQDAATKNYVDTSVLLVGTKGFTVSINVSGMLDPTNEIIPYLEKLLPISNPTGFEYLNLPVYSRVRVLCSSMSFSIAPGQLASITEQVAQVKDISNVTQNVVKQGFSVTIPTSTQIIPSITYVVRQYIVNPSLAWQFDGIIN